jgi:acetyltransferase-like isoleucine patch superfamily enzyme
MHKPTDGALAKGVVNGGGWRVRIRRVLGRGFMRLEGYAAEYKTELRREGLAKIARIHPTAMIPETVGFANNQGNPDSIVIGANSAVLGELIVFPQGGCIDIGKRTFIGSGTRIWSAASIKIGNYVLIAHNVNIHDNISHSTEFDKRREEIDHVLPHLRLLSHSFDIKARCLTIEDNAWIGFGASIIGGVTIGTGAIVGAGTMVTKSVAPHTVVVGNPMRVVKVLDGKGPKDAEEV